MATKLAVVKWKRDTTLPICSCGECARLEHRHLKDDVSILPRNVAKALQDVGLVEMLQVWRDDVDA